MHQCVNSLSPAIHKDFFFGMNPTNIEGIHRIKQSIGITKFNCPNETKLTMLQQKLTQNTCFGVQTQQQLN